MAKRITRDELDAKRRNNTADSCYFFIPATAAGRKLLAMMRANLNRSCYKMRFKNRGPSHSSYNDVYAKDALYFSVYFDSTGVKSKQTREFEEYRQRQLEKAWKHDRDCARLLAEAVAKVEAECTDKLMRQHEASYGDGFDNGVAKGRADRQSEIRSMSLFRLILWHFRKEV